MRQHLPDVRAQADADADDPLVPCGTLASGRLRNAVPASLPRSELIIHGSGLPADQALQPAAKGAPPGVSTAQWMRPGITARRAMGHGGAGAD